MLDRLRNLQQENRPVRVGLVGAGAMGLGIARQIGITPGMELAFATDLSLPSAERAARASGQNAAPVAPGRDLARRPGACLFGDDSLAVLTDPAIEFDVLVEASNSIGPAARYCRAAIEGARHVVLMNAEVDLALGPLLQQEAKRSNVVVTSDGGDQHGVLKRMIDDILLWGFRIVQAGNIKGFLDRYATAEGLAEEAAKRYLDPVQCCAYTDGTKLNIEMALIANGLGLLPARPGMEGPACADVHEVMTLFDFDGYGDTGRVDYVLGAEPSGGVYVVGHCDDELQMRYLNYYKLGEGPYYLFYRPYHLCHFETPRVIAECALAQEALLRPDHGRVTDVYAYTKRPVRAGTSIEHGIGGDHFYGLIDERDNGGRVPITLLEPDDGSRAVVITNLEKDQPLTWDDVEIPETYLVRSWREQDLIGDGLHDG
ncbi:homoserine dehydrogenase [Pseudomonadota bacterium]